MSSLEAAIAEVKKGPSGPRIAAFFDFDGTLNDGYKVAEFFKHRLLKGEIGLEEAGRLLLSGIRGIETEADFDEFVTVGFRAFRGKTEAEMEALGERLFVESIARCLYPEAWPLIEAHRLRGHTLVIASSATRFQIQPMARELGIEHVLCTGIQVRKGVLTGRPSGALAWGEGKADAVRRFAARRRIDLERSYAYANGDEDLAFLQTVGRPRAVNPQPRLAGAANKSGWPVLSFPPRGGRPDLLTIARSVAAYAGMAGGLGVGLWAGLLKGSHREAVNRSAALIGDLGLSIAGIEIRVQGEEHLWSHRPAMFLFNHQSQLDVLILAKLLRENYSGVAKANTRNVPGFGQFFRFAGVAFVEPGHKAQNRAALAPAAAKLKSGLSLVMAPEGTRSPTPRLGATFRKGAFHLAMQARVPIVPIVIRNAGALLRRGEVALRAGTVEVVVLPPMPTRRWKIADLDQHVIEVRQRFVETLANWPSAGDPAQPAPAPTQAKRATPRRAPRKATGRQAR